jgi:chemotaxis protein CheD
MTAPPKKVRYENVVQVPIGGIAVAAHGQVLSTLLGSCVGLVVQDLRRQIAVLAHVVRPNGVGVGMGPGYFADQAAPRARDLAIQAGADPRDLMVRIAGGGRMAGGGIDVGARNAEAIKAATYALGMAYGGHVDGPADGGCVLFVIPAKGKLVVRRLAGDRLDDASWKQMVKEVTAA